MASPLQLPRRPGGGDYGSRRDPLLQDIFWVAMAVTITFGLAFGTVLTMILLPTN